MNQHAYLAHYDGRYWAMRSDRPGLPNPKLTPAQHRNVVPGHDRPDTQVSCATSEDGLSWSKIVKTNFPDATSKFFVLRTSRGYYAIVSNSNPRRRDPPTLAISQDGLVFTNLFYLVGGRHVDYPHIIEHDGHLMIAFSGAKQTMEVLKVSLSDLDTLMARETTE